MAGYSYSIEEAELAIKEHDMDIYHRELMQFLVNSNKELEDKLNTARLQKMYLRKELDEYIPKAITETSAMTA